MQLSEQEWISKRAYTLWEKEGQPHGRDSDHWEQAKKEYALLETSYATKPATKKKAAAKTTEPLIEISTKPKSRAGKVSAK
jgi:hypothetical protein